MEIVMTTGGYEVEGRGVLNYSTTLPATTILTSLYPTFQSGAAVRIRDQPAGQGLRSPARRRIQRAEAARSLPGISWLPDEISGHDLPRPRPDSRRRHALGPPEQGLPELPEDVLG